MSRFAVAGATSWGLTLAWLLSCNGHDVVVVTRNAAETDRLRDAGHSERMPAITFGPTLRPVAPGSLEAPLDGVVLAVPAQSLRGALGTLTTCHGLPLLSAAKGIELESGQRMSEVIAGCGFPPGTISVLSGPNLAQEIVAGLPAAAVVASHEEAQAAMWQSALSGGSFRVYRSRDVTGVELCGALKNVVAIAAGAGAGLGFGANTIAAIVTRGLAEITRLGTAAGAEPLTFQGLAGVGDLTATCFSPLSRNRRLGELLAAGKSPADALTEIHAAVEGVATAKVALALGARYGVDLPIATQVAAVLEGRTTVAGAMSALLTRPLTGER
ncbi:hypothetical protein AYO38_01175 [bacterium SCGC AG-212-C10]|nr:hypothetical protein AYO38_01175 [bacterium SCGC AG-212-C10]